MSDVDARSTELRQPWGDERVLPYLERLGLPGVVDLHVHFMPQNVLDKVWAFFDGVGSRLGQEWPITYRTDEEERARTLARLGVRRFSTLNYAHRPGMADWLNDYSTAFAARHPQVIHSATFFPEPEGDGPAGPDGSAPSPTGGGAAGQVDRALAAGARIFKVHVQVGAFSPLDPWLEAAWARLEQSGTPVVIHCGSGPTPGEHTGPDPIRTLLRRYQRLVLVIAHGGMPEYREFADLALEYPGVYLDTTMLCTDYAERMAPSPANYADLLASLAGKVVLGTDFPNIPYPYAHQLQVLDALGLGDEWMRQVLWGTPRRLVGLGD